jgi:exonuclease SbcD
VKLLLGSYKQGNGKPAGVAKRAYSKMSRVTGIILIRSAMARFLHIADVHLGIRRYKLPDRTTDFFRAWKEVIERYAIGRRVDFVVIAGDLFDQKRVDPQAANHAMICLRRLERERIPVVVIEGNHDARETGSRHSWLRSFSQWRYIKLLEPTWSESGVELHPWDEDRLSGGYIDIGDARIFGSTWYGTTVCEALPPLSEAVRQNRRNGATNIMLLHSDIEGQLNRPTHSTLPMSKLVMLREAVDYLALGHTHKQFEIDGWAFNPGSLEACSADEATVVRGAYLVETDGPRIKTEFLRAGTAYFQRPFKRIEYQVKGDQEPDQIHSGVLELIRRECPASSEEVEDDHKPIIEVTLRGQIGFKNSLLRLDKLQEQAMELYRPLGLIINNKTVPKQLAVAIGLTRDIPRSERELRVIQDLIKPDSRFGARAGELAELIVEVKRLALAGEPPEKLLRLLKQRFFQLSEPTEAASTTSNPETADVTNLDAAADN